jgi:hypothetical protein
MPQVPGRTIYSFLRRTNVNLERSEHSVPAEAFQLDDRLPDLFQDFFAGQYYWPNQGWVKIGKGRIVASIRPPLRYGQYGRPMITVCNGGNQVTYGNGYIQAENIPIGVVAFNLLKEVFDQQSGNLATVLTDRYIEVPFVAGSTYADDIKTGVAYGDIDFNILVKSDSYGRFVKWDPTSDAVAQIVGRVWVVETEVPPEGWLQWAMGPRTQWDINWPTLIPSTITPEGYIYSSEYIWPTYPEARGMENLTDGKRFGGIVYTDEPVANADGTDGKILASDTRGTVKTFWVRNAPIAIKDATGAPIENPLIIKVGTATRPTSAYTFDYASGKITYTCTQEDEDLTVDTPVYATYRRGFGIPGIPRNWDEAGALGAVRILLCL